MTRRFLFWILPLTAAVLAASIFVYGFVSYLRGDTGTAVSVPIERTSASAPKVRTQQVAPVILGDSLARGAGDETGLGIGGRLDAELKRLGVNARRTYNVGVSGARTRDLLALLDRPNVQQLLRDSNVIIVSIGGNDLWGGTDWRTIAPDQAKATMDGVLQRVDAVIVKVRAANPKARIFFIGLYNPFVQTPMGGELTRLVNLWNARLLERFGGDPNFTLVPTSDLFSHHDRLALDRFHPGGEGYGLIARRIAESV